LEEDLQLPLDPQRGCEPRKIEHTGWRSKVTDVKGQLPRQGREGTQNTELRLALPKDLFLSLEESMGN